MNVAFVFIDEEVCPVSIDQIICQKGQVNLSRMYNCTEPIHSRWQRALPFISFNFCAPDIIIKTSSKSLAFHRTSPHQITGWRRSPVPSHQTCQQMIQKPKSTRYYAIKTHFAALSSALTAAKVGMSRNTEKLWEQFRPSNYDKEDIFGRSSNFKRNNKVEQRILTSNFNNFS